MKLTRGAFKARNGFSSLVVGIFIPKSRKIETENMISIKTNNTMSDVAITENMFFNTTKGWFSSSLSPPLYTIIRGIPIR